MKHMHGASSFCIVSLFAMSTLIGFSTSTPTPYKNEMRKRIFCNFYGCGSKRSFEPASSNAFQTKPTPNIHDKSYAVQADDGLLLDSPENSFYDIEMPSNSQGPLFNKKIQQALQNLLHMSPNLRKKREIASEIAAYLQDDQISSSFMGSRPDAHSHRSSNH